MGSTESFLANLQRSKLLEPEAFSAIEEDLWADGMQRESDEILANMLVERGEITRWQADRILAGRFRGFRLGEYRLLDLLGQGGMGVVYLAEHAVLKCRLAIKVLKLGVHEENRHRIERFRREAETISNLCHENIIGAIEVHSPTDDCDKTYLVMELVEGVTLQKMVLDNGPLDVRRTVAYLIQACRGLHHAHSHGYVHRDVKPANLMVRRTGQVMLLDLGLASSSDFLIEEEATARSFVGTADYVSPEQARNNQRIDPRSDIYSLGCTAYFLLTGCPPFNEQSIASRLVAHQLYEPKALSELRKDIPTDITNIIGRMMAKDVSQRFSSTRDLEQALQTVFDSLPGGESVEIAPPDKAAELAVTEAPQSSPAKKRVPKGLRRSNQFWSPVKASLAVVVSWFSIFSFR